LNLAAPNFELGPLNLELFQSWLADLERRHLADLRFSEVTRGLRALSSTCVQRRARPARRSAWTATCGPARQQGAAAP
jgi:hypothetical protein